MPKKTNHIELLAPAKDLECGIAAITCGADAVYIGAPEFSARYAASNSIDDIAKLVDFAHLYYAKVYVALNTILTDEELLSAEKMIKVLYKSGIDALIIQDTGILELDLPPLPLISSTQMHNDTPEKIIFLQNVGFKRVILARELSLEQIKEIKNKSEIELEVFIHGSLCVCYSGQCYLSYALGGRSGNRGVCAQPCRKPYDLIDAKGSKISINRHLLSLKDLNLSEYIEDLVDAGVSSLKIEGRLKDKNYVKNVVLFYRNKIDEILGKMDLSKSSEGTTFTDFSPNPTKTFNRGYTTYFLYGRKKDITSFETPKFTGDFIGNVNSKYKNHFTVDAETDLKSGDGISFDDRKGVLTGTFIKKVEKDKIYPEDISEIRVGTQIYRNLDNAFMKALNKAKIERKIPVSFDISHYTVGLKLTVYDESGNYAEEMLSIPINEVVSSDRDKMNKAINEKLSKLGNSHYYCTEIRISINNPLYIQPSLLNNARRNIVEKLTHKRIDNYPISKAIISKNDYPYPEKHLNYNANILNEKAKTFYTRHGVTEIEFALEKGLPVRDKILMKTKHCLRYSFDLCPKENKEIDEAESLYLIDDETKLQVDFDCRNCVMIVKLTEL